MKPKIAVQLVVLLALLFANASRLPADDTQQQISDASQSETKSTAPRSSKRSLAEMASRITPRLPEFIKKADQAVLQGNSLTADGDYQTAQKKFLKALNLLNGGEDQNFPQLERREAYARQLLVAIQAEIKERDTKRETKR